MAVLELRGAQIAISVVTPCCAFAARAEDAAHDLDQWRLDPSHFTVDRKPFAIGTNAQVFMGSCLFDGHRVAVKRVTNTSKELQNEVRALLSLHHPHFVEFFGFLDCDDSAPFNFLVTEFCEGGTALDLFSRTFADVAWALRVLALAQTASAIAFLHAAGAIHLDLKVDNILLALPVPTGGRTVDVRVADPGMLRWAPRAGSDGFVSEFIGRPLPVGAAYYWIAPELAQGVVSPAVDVYGLGAAAADAATRCDERSGDWARHAPAMPQGLRELVVACGLRAAERPSAADLCARFEEAYQAMAAMVDRQQPDRLSQHYVSEPPTPSETGVAERLSAGGGRRHRRRARRGTPTPNEGGRGVDEQ